MALSLAVGGTDHAQAAVGDVITLTGSGGPGVTDGTGLSASFFNPWAVVSDGLGNAFVADTDNNLIRKVELSTGRVSTVAGNGTQGATDGPALNSSFYYPSGLAWISSSRLAIADSFNREVRVLDFVTQTVSTLAGSPSANGLVDGVGSAASFGEVYDVASDGAGNLYVADGGALTSSIRKIVVATGQVTTVAGNGTVGSLNGIGSAAQFASPSGVAVSGNNLYVADTFSNKIRVVDLTTTAVTDLAGSGNSGSSDGPSTLASFDQPHRVAVSGNTLYVADTYNDKIRAIDLGTNIVRTISGSGIQGNNSGPALSAQFNKPVGIAVDPSGYLLVADVFNHSIRATEVNPLTTAYPAATTTTTSTTTTSTTTTPSTTTATTTTAVSPASPPASETLTISVAMPSATDGAPKVCDGGTGTIQGDVIDDVDNNYTRDATEKSLSGVKVSLRRGDGLVCQSTETRSPYTFTNVAAGDYEVVISALAGRPETAAVYRVSVDAGKSATVTEHYIAPAGPTTTAAGAAATSTVASLTTPTAVPPFALPGASVAPPFELALEAAPAEELAFTGVGSGLLAALSMCFAGAGALLVTLRRRTNREV